nr:ATP-binding protein [Paenibacillus monticola]
MPLIENSIYHSIKEKEGHGLIKVKIVQKRERLSIIVIDNGNGILPENLHEIEQRLLSDEERTEHVGLYNTHKRLKLTYEKGYSLRIKRNQASARWLRSLFLYWTACKDRLYLESVNVPSLLLTEATGRGCPKSIGRQSWSMVY